MDARGALAERGFLALRSRDTKNTPQWNYAEEAEVLTPPTSIIHYTDQQSLK